LATLISLMLSSQTKDEVTDAAVAKLRLALGGTLSLDALLAAEEHVIADSINKVGFWRRKTQSVSPIPSFSTFGTNRDQVYKASCAAFAGRL
jgi:endonuclease III